MAVSNVSAGSGKSKNYSCILHIKANQGKILLLLYITLDIPPAVGSYKDVCCCAGILKASVQVPRVKYISFSSLLSQTQCLCPASSAVSSS